MNSEQIIRIVSPVLTFLFTSMIGYYLKERSKLVSYYGHISAFKLHDPDINIHTHSIIITNKGKKSANNVRVCHLLLPKDSPPLNVNVFPPVQYSMESNPEGAMEILIPILSPNEQVTISYLYFPPLTYGQINSVIKSDEGLAQSVNAIATPQPSRILTSVAWFFIFVGGSYILYWIIKLLILIIK